MTARRLTPLMLLLALGPSCDSGPIEPRLDLAEAQARWASRGPASYDYDFVVSCFCLFPGYGRATISVRNGQFTNIVSTDSGTVIDSVAYRGYLTIDQLFAAVHRIIEGKPPRFTAVYDPALGYPAEAREWDPMVGDAYLTLEVRALRPVPNP